MHTHITTHRPHKLFALAAILAGGVGGRAARIARAMKALAPPARHRMGSWEENASLGVRALRDAAGDRCQADAD